MAADVGIGTAGKTGAEPLADAYRWPPETGLGEGMINHYGTTPLIRQCVTPGMMAMHEGRTYRVSAVIQERKWVYLHTDAEIIRLSDCVIDVLLDGHGNPLTH